MATKRNQRRLGRPRKLKPELHSETFCVRCTPSEIKRLGKAAAAAAQPPSAWAREKLMMMVVGVLSRSTKEAGRKGKGPRESVLNKAWTLMVESVLARERLLRAGVRAAVESVAIAAVSRRRRRKSKARLPAKHARTEHFCMALRWIQHTMVLEAADVLGVSARSWVRAVLLDEADKALAKPVKPAKSRGKRRAGITAS